MNSYGCVAEAKEAAFLSRFGPKGNTLRAFCFKPAGCSYSTVSEMTVRAVNAFHPCVEGTPPDIMIGAPGWIVQNQALISRHTAILTMHEGTAFTAEEVEVFNKARCVIIPSFWGLTQLSSVATVPIRVCPLGVRLCKFSPKTRSDTYTFLTIAGYNGTVKRKGLPEVLEAFSNVRASGLPVRLIVRCPAQAVPAKAPEGVQFVTQWLSDEGMEELIQQCDCGVVASSGEGFCMCIPQFHSAGKPVISPTIGPIGELFSIPSFLRVDGDIVFGSTNHMDRGRYFKPSVLSLSKAMTLASKAPYMFMRTLGEHLSASAVQYSETAFALRVYETLKSVNII